jgi:hypothetical protein
MGQKLVNLLKNSQKDTFSTKKAIFSRITQKTAFSANLDFLPQAIKRKAITGHKP